MLYQVAALSSAIQDRLGEPGLLGTIHSVFDHAVNIHLRNEPRIVALTFPGAGRLPYAWTLADPSSLSFPSVGLKTGMQATLMGPGRVEIPAAGVIVDFHDAGVWSPRMQPLADPDEIPAFLDLIDWASSFVFRQANQAGLVPLLGIHRPVLNGIDAASLAQDQTIARLAVPPIKLLLHSLAKDDAVGLKESVAGLVGYGIGGTPSGDDLLVGMLAAFHRSTRSNALSLRYRLTNALQAHLSEDVTSLLSLTVIRHALAGEFSEKIHEVTLQMLHPSDPETLQDSLERLLMHGATSGSEMLLGLCLGFQVLFPI